MADGHESSLGLTEEDSAKLTAILTFRSFDRVVYLSPRMVAVRNPDGIFEEEGADHGRNFVLSQNGTLEVFLFKPAFNLYERILSGLQEQEEDGSVADLRTYLEIGMKDRKTLKLQTLDGKYTKGLQVDRVLLGNEKDIVLVNLGNVDPLEDAEKLGEMDIIGKFVLQYWRKIYKEDVQLLTDAEIKSLCRYENGNEPIAIVGMSCRFPGSNNLEEFWNLLFTGGDGTGNPPPFRWLREQKNNPECKKINAGFLSLPVEDFDAKFFGISPKEIMFMDPQHRFLHELVWEGLEDACINPHELKGTLGSVFVGSWTNDYKEVLKASGNSEFLRTYMGNSIGAAAARISHLLGIVGPSVATDSACSSSMVATHLACRSLQNRETNMALACGVNLRLLLPFAEMPIMIVSPEGRCKTFCEKADGFGRAEGCGVLVLKRLSDAMRDKDKIWALVRGSAMVQEGTSKSIGTPTVHCESLAMTGALRDAGVGPEEVSYLEAHGTGTVVGDSVEVASIARAYHTSLREEPLIIGSVKTNVGHTESCSGITGIIKVALAMHHEIIPAHRNFVKLNPAIDLDSIPAKIPFQPMEWMRSEGKTRIAGVSSMGITGTDAHVILEESPQSLAKQLPMLEEEFERPIHLIKLSAKTENALNILLEKYHRQLSTTEEALANIAYSGNVGRADFNHRAAIIAKSKEELVGRIEERNFMRGEFTPEEDVGKICFLFTGQGSQYPGMAQQLYQTSPVFRMHFDFCGHILKKSYSIDITHVLWGPGRDEISRTIYSQTSIFCVEYALLKLWESWGVRPDISLGHSLGEFAAAVCAGILNVEDALKLVAERSLLIDQLPEGKMLVIRASENYVNNLLAQFRKELDYAAINSSEQTVVAGDPDVVLEFSKFCHDNEIKSTVLGASHAFHSKHMDIILEKYEQISSTVARGRGNGCGYISGMLGDLIPATGINGEYWVQHTRKKVSFLNASQNAVKLGCTVFIEIGPQPISSALTMTNNAGINLTCLPSLKKSEEDWTTILSSLGWLYLRGFPVDWQGFDQFYARKKVQLPSYPFIRKTFWPDMMIVSGGRIHPLLGSSIPNPSATKLFTCGINLNTHDYIRDHAIGENILMPGAAYLEMCLAAGLATVQNAVGPLGKPMRPMKIENLKIETPLALHESRTTEVQTVVELNIKSESADWNDMSVQIFQRVGEESGSSAWFSHAKATFCPVPSVEEQQINFDDIADLRQIVQHGKKRDFEKLLGKLSENGLNVGPSFKRFEKVWRAEQDSTFLAKISKPPQVETQQHDYILHPTLLDAMIQSILFSKLSASTVKNKLFVPITIGKFVWLAQNETEETYIYAYETGSGGEKGEFSFPTTASLLLDGKGMVLAVMSGIDFIETTVKVIEAVLEQQNTSLPGLWEEVWRGKVGPNQFRQNLQLCNGEPFHDEGFREEMISRYNVLDEEQKDIFSGLNRLVYCYLLRAMYHLGWKPPPPGTLFSQSELATQFGIQHKHLQYFSYILQVLEAEGILKGCGHPSVDIWQVIASPPELEPVETELHSQALRELLKTYRSASLLFNVGDNLHEILVGKKSPLYFLFPGETKAGTLSAASVYADHCTLLRVQELSKRVAQTFLTYWKRRQAEIGEKFVVRILEIGSGTGTYTKYFLQSFKEAGIEFELTFTDVSVTFFPPAQKLLAEYGNAIHYKKLNIEEDPITQGFIPSYYDYVCASEVIHATRDIRESLRNVHCLLKPMGRFDVHESTRASRSITYLVGLLEGYWRFTDADLRPSHCALSMEGWKEALESTGFDLLDSFPYADGYHSLIITRKSLEEKCGLESSDNVWLLFDHQPSPLSNFLLEKIPHLTNRQVVTVRQGEEYSCSKDAFTVVKTSQKDFISVMEAMEGRKVEGVIYCWSLDGKADMQEEILQPYFHLVKSLSSLSQRDSLRLIAITNGVVQLEDNSISHFQTSTIWGFTKSLQNENAGLNCRLIDICGEEGGPENMMQIFYEIWNDAKEIQVAYSGGTRYIPKFQPVKPVMADLKLPAGADRFQLVLPESKSIKDLAFGPLERFSLGEEDVEIQIKASALNFRDVFSVLKPTEKFEGINAVGCDFAGIVKRVGSKVTKWLVGDEVFGVNANGKGLPSHVEMQQDDVLPVGDQMTLCEAATLPAVFATSYHCLIEVAKVTSEDTVLIHTASGGVGLSAIQLCQHLRAKVICTAGSKRKQNYLRNLGIQHIFHSRTTKYGEEILKLTGGRGVDVVLNSLTSEGFREATLMACAKGARFVEMSKLSIWTPAEVKSLRPDVDYTVVDISAMNNEDLRRLTNATKHLVDEDIIQPIPYVRFDGLNIGSALRYLQEAKHIGKVVCVMPELKQKNCQTVTGTPIFNLKSTYLITGGLGGIGFLVCQWMVEKGAKYVLLAGRNPPKSSTAEAISQLNSQHDAKVVAVELDVSNFSHCKKIFKRSIPEMGYPPVRGVMHCAGILHDGFIQNQIWPSFSSTLKTKVEGTLNLHELTKDSNLEHFVLFSSTSALLGSPGQSNHASGNNFEDTFAHYRHSMGLPATSINWGQWGQVGVAKELDLAGFKPLSNLQGTAALEFALKSHRNQTCAANIDSVALLAKLHPHVLSYFDKRVGKANQGIVNTSFVSKTEKFWELYDSKGDDLVEKLKVIQEMLRELLRNTLQLDISESIQIGQDFQEMGVDSLMFIEIRNAVQTRLGDRVTVNASTFRQCNTIQLLSTNLMKLISGNESMTEDFSHIPTFEEVAKLIRKDCQLPEHIRARGDQEVFDEKGIQCVLLTGSTGTLGPHLLRELTCSPQISSVICLIRPRRNQSGEERLGGVLEERDLLKQVDMKKMCVVSGDVAKPRFGMEPGVWEDMSNKVEAIVHCAANVSHVDHYKEHQGKDYIREVNVEGMKNVLDFSCTGSKLKHIFHCSSIAAGLLVDEKGALTEEWPGIGGYDGVTTLAYPVTKFIGELLLKEGIERGIPVKALRFPIITGDSKTGRFVLAQNHLMLCYLYVLKTGKISSTFWPIFSISVDICAEVALKLFFDERCRDDVINLTPDRVGMDLEFVGVAKKLGYHVEVVKYSEFTEELKDSSVEDSPFLLFKEIYHDEKTYSDMFVTIPLLREWMVEGGNKGRKLFHSKKLARLIPDFNEKLVGCMDSIYRDLLFAREQGWLQKYAPK